MSPALEQRLAAGIVWAIVACAYPVAGLPVAWALHVAYTSPPVDQLALLEVWRNVVAALAGSAGVGAWIALACYARAWARGAAAAVLEGREPEPEEEEEP